MCLQLAHNHAEKMNLTCSVFLFTAVRSQHQTIKNQLVMTSERKNQMSEVMQNAWQFFHTTGMEFSECLKQAWKNLKLKINLHKGIVKFYFEKVDGTLREAWGTLVADRIPATTQVERRKNPTTQVYYDTEKQEYRCFKKLNLARIAQVII